MMLILYLAMISGWSLLVNQAECKNLPSYSSRSDDEFEEVPNVYYNLSPVEGAYEFGFKLKNQEREETRTPDGKVKGSYSFKDPVGERHQFTYLADENGYQPESNSIPQVPVDTPAVTKAKESFYAYFEKMQKFIDAIRKRDEAIAQQTKVRQQDTTKDTKPKDLDSSSSIVGPTRNYRLGSQYRGSYRSSNDLSSSRKEEQGKVSDSVVAEEEKESNGGQSEGLAIFVGAPYLASRYNDVYQNNYGGYYSYPEPSKVEATGDDRDESSEDDDESSEEDDDESSEEDDDDESSEEDDDYDESSEEDDDYDESSEEDDDESSEEDDDESSEEDDDESSEEDDDEDDDEDDEDEDEEDDEDEHEEEDER